MFQPYSVAPATFYFCMLGLLAPLPTHAGGKSAPTTATAPTAAASGAIPAVPATAALPAAVPAPDKEASRGLRKPGRPPGPLKHLSFSAREGFALRMVSDQDVTAEIRNGAGRTLAHAAYTLQAGNWTLRPKNLAPGLYTVLLRTGPNLRSLRMKIVDAERGKGGPEWVLEKSSDSTRAPDPTASRDAFLIRD